MQMAFIVAQESKCVSWKVGALIVKDTRIISMGYNGTPTKHKNCCDHAEDNDWLEDGKFRSDCSDMHHEWSNKNEIHAELNAILFAAKRGISIEGSTLYTTVAPCYNCAKAISQSGVKNLVYCVEYPGNETAWMRILKESGISISKIDKVHMNMLQWENIQDKTERV